MPGRWWWKESVQQAWTFCVCSCLPRQSLTINYFHTKHINGTNSICSTFITNTMSISISQTFTHSYPNYNLIPRLFYPFSPCCCYPCSLCVCKHTSFSRSKSACHHQQQWGKFWGFCVPLLYFLPSHSTSLLVAKLEPTANLHYSYSCFIITNHLSLCYDIMALINSVFWGPFHHIFPFILRFQAGFSLLFPSMGLIAVIIREEGKDEGRVWFWVRGSLLGWN